VPNTLTTGAPGGAPTERATKAPGCSSRRARTRQWFDALAIGVLIVVAAIAALTFRDYGLGWDDYAHAQYGDLLVSLYRSGFADQRAFSFVNLYMYGGGFDVLATLAKSCLSISTRRGAWPAPSSALRVSWSPGAWDAGCAVILPA
jgi:hypothetical protein